MGRLTKVTFYMILGFDIIKQILVMIQNYNPKQKQKWKQGSMEDLGVAR